VLFCENSNARKAIETQVICLINFDFTYLKICNFLTLNHVMANLTRKTCTKLCQNRPRFVKDTTETFWCVFRLVHSSNCCSLEKREC